MQSSEDTNAALISITILEDALALWGEAERAAHCTRLCHGTQTMNSSRACDCLLSVREATVETHAWTKLHTQLMS